MNIKYLFALLLFTHNVTAQKITLSGYVSDAKTAERLVGANVYIPSLNIGTRSNTYGFYSLTFDAQTETNTIVCSYLGYVQKRDSGIYNQNQQIDIKLSPTKELKEVVIKSNKAIPIQENTQMSNISIPIETIKKLPAFLGEVDVLKSLQLLPGIQAGNEGQNGLYVRGGGPDQNLILLDGVPVYNASHLFGFFSVFNADAVSNVEVYKGGFPARYGGRLSSVIDIRMKEGTKSGGIHGSAGIGLISSRLMLEGPFGKNNKKGSWMISGRRTYIDLLTTPIIKAASNGQGTGGYYFWDANAKANYKISKRDHIYLSAYMGKDKFFAKAFENKQEVFRANINWGNVTAMFRWNHEFSNKLFGNLTATHSRYNFVVGSRIVDNFGGSSSVFSTKYSSGIYDWGLKYDVDYIPNPKHYIKAGIGAVYHTFKPGAITIKGDNIGTGIDTAYNVSQVPEFDIYVEDDIELTKSLKANIGIHASAFKTKSSFYPSLQPRISARYLLHPEWSVKASFCTMTQFIHLLTNNGIGLPTDLWVPVTDKIKPQQSYQGALGVAHTLADQYEFSVEGYYKKMHNIIEYKDGAGFLNSNQSWEEKVEMGDGWSYGAEFFIQKKTGRLSGLMGYTLSWTNRQFPTINNALRFPYKYDRRHDFKVAAVYALAKRVEISGDWVYGTGNAISMPLYKYNAAPINNGVNSGLYGGNTIYHYGTRNNYRMMAYHRLDLGINFIKTTKRGWERTWNISIYNVYSRKNPFFIYPTQDSVGNDIFKQISLFPVLPSFTYNLKF